MSNTIPNEEVKFLVIGNHYFGKGRDLASAKRAFTRAGGKLRNGYAVFEFDAEHVFEEVTFVGDVRWTGDITTNPKVTYHNIPKTQAR